MTRLEQLLAEQAAIVEAGGEIGPELQGMIGWHRDERPSQRHDFDSSLSSAEQCDAWQEYFAGWEAEARHSMGVE